MLALWLPSVLRAQTNLVGTDDRAFNSAVDQAAFGEVWPAEVAAPLQNSSLVYLSPIRLTGELSRCQAEVWFVVDGADVLVVTSSQAWRALALQRGLNTARFWVGDVGVGAQSGGRYLGLPSIDVIGRVDNEPANHERALELFGEKYKTAWVFWRRSFRLGLADGKRTMIRYSYGI